MNYIRNPQAIKILGILGIIAATLLSLLVGVATASALLCGLALSAVAINGLFCIIHDYKRNFRTDTQ